MSLWLLGLGLVLTGLGGAGRPLLPVELRRPKWAEQVDWGVELGVRVGLSKPAQSWWVVVRAWLRAIQADELEVRDEEEFVEDSEKDSEEGSEEDSTVSLLLLFGGFRKGPWVLGWGLF